MMTESVDRMVRFLVLFVGLIGVAAFLLIVVEYSFCSFSSAEPQQMQERAFEIVKSEGELFETELIERLDIGIRDFRCVLLPVESRDDVVRYSTGDGYIFEYVGGDS